ncbi:MAG: YiiX/YebB-like N1pC/P60 family cysteine hydrolase [Gemmatimonadota bacterium]
MALPSPVPDLRPAGAVTAFRWDADALFRELEAAFERAGGTDLAAATAAVERLAAEGEGLLAGLGGRSQPPHDELARLATLQFELAVQGAAHPSLLSSVQDFLIEARVALMGAASAWLPDRRAHEALYRVLFGGRIALDEALMQAGSDALPQLVEIEDVPSAAPSVEIEGVRIHSGDILLSRGGAPTSALIARGNDFPNTFSHVALAHVDAATGEATVIESLIETGSVLTSVEGYLEAKRHRILVLRLDDAHPAGVANPLVAHQAAEAMLARVRDGDMPYDFAMDWRDAGEAFCSEIVYHAYRERGVDLWPLRSAMSAPGLVAWLAAMGVREFNSLVPSDVEYDPQLRAVAEWRDAPALMDFRLDNAITDALLEEAERGATLGYAWFALPVARLLKGYSVLRSAVGATPTIPSGMGPSTALRVDALVSRIHPPLKENLVTRAGRFQVERGYEAPYWTLVELARESVAEMRDSLAPALTTR